MRHGQQPPVAMGASKAPSMANTNRSATGSKYSVTAAPGSNWHAGQLRHQLAQRRGGMHEGVGAGISASSTLPANHVAGALAHAQALARTRRSGRRAVAGSGSGQFQPARRPSRRSRPLGSRFIGGSLKARATRIEQAVEHLGRRGRTAAAALVQHSV